MKTLLISSVLLFFSCSSHKKHHHKHHRFDDANKWSKIFENKKRDKWQEPLKVIRAIGINKKSIVADIGSATGYFPIRIAKVADDGRVWGIDIEPNLVNFLNKRARSEKVSNLFSILGTFNDPLIPEKVDFILVVNTFHHIEKRNIYFEKLRKSLKANGKLVIIDFRKGKLPFGPKDKMKISKEKIISELRSSGYKLIKDHGFLKYQNLLVFK